MKFFYTTGNLHNMWGGTQENAECRNLIQCIRNEIHDFQDPLNCLINFKILRSEVIVKYHNISSLATEKNY